MKNKKILVTGGAGFIGSHICDLLVAEECAEIVALDNMIRGRPENLADAMKSDTVRIVDGDICDEALLDQLIGDADIVFHLAALRITHCAAEPRLAIDVMVDATARIAELCVKHEIEKVIMSSSASVYGMADTFPTKEDHHPYDNRTLYGAAKTFNEGLFRSYNDMFGLDYVGFRYFNAYGTRMDIHGKYTEVLVRWMQRIERDEPPLIFGDGLHTMDFVNVRDIARANILGAKNEATDTIFNIASGTETSLRELATMLTEVMGKPGLEPEFGPERSVNPVPRRLADTTYAREQLGFESTISVREGLSELVDWWRSEKERFPEA